MVLAQVALVGMAKNERRRQSKLFRINAVIYQFVVTNMNLNNVSSFEFSNDCTINGSIYIISELLLYQDCKDISV